jgi:hypothetical protein
MPKWIGTTLPLYCCLLTLLLQGQGDHLPYYLLPVQRQRQKAMGIGNSKMPLHCGAIKPYNVVMSAGCESDTGLYLATPV